MKNFYISEENMKRADKYMTNSSKYINSLLNIIAYPIFIRNKALQEKLNNPDKRTKTGGNEGVMRLQFIHYLLFDLQLLKNPCTNYLYTAINSTETLKKLREKYGWVDSGKRNSFVTAELRRLESYGFLERIYSIDKVNIDVKRGRGTSIKWYNIVMKPFFYDYIKENLEFDENYLPTWTESDYNKLVAQLESEKQVSFTKSSITKVTGKAIKKEGFIKDKNGKRDINEINTIDGTLAEVQEDVNPNDEKDDQDYEEDNFGLSLPAEEIY